MRRAGLYEGLRGNLHPKRRECVYYIQFLMFPISGILFVTLLSIVAQMSHFRTDKLNYVVSLKPSQLTASRYDLSLFIEVGTAKGTDKISSSRIDELD